MTQPSSDPLVSIVFPDGSPGTVPRSQLAQALAVPGVKETGSPAPETSAAEQFATFGLKGLDALTMGASDAFLASEWAGSPEYNRSQVQHMYEDNPRAAMTGTVAGLIAGGGEIGAVPGEALENLTTRALSRDGASALEQFAVRRIGNAVRGGVEMMPMNVGNQISEDALGDKQTNSEKILAAMFNRDTALGAGLGAGLGGGLELAGRLVPKGIRLTRTADDIVAEGQGIGSKLHADASAEARSVDELQRAGFTSDQARGVVGDATRLADQAHAEGVLGSVSDIIAKAHAGGNQAAEDVYKAAFDHARSGHVDADAVLNTNARRLAKNVDSVLEDLQRTSDDLSYNQKSAQFARKVDPSKIDAARDALNSHVQRIRAGLDELSATATKGGPGGANSIKKVSAALSDAEARIAKGLDAAQSFTELDKLRKVVKGEAKFGLADHFTNDAQFAFRNMYEDMRQTLMDPTVYGEAAATANRELNASHEAQLATKKFFEGKFATEYGRYADSAERAMRADPMKIRAYLSDAHVDQEIGGLAGRSMDDFISAQRNRAREVQQHLTMTGEERAAFDRGLRNLDELERTLGEVRKESAVQAQLKSMRVGETSHTHGLGGMLADVLLSPLKTMERLGALQHVLDRVTGASKKHVRAFVEGTAPVVTRGVDKGHMSALADRSKLLGSNPDALASHAQTLAGDMPRYAPGHSSQMTAQFSRVVSYLAANAPKGYEPGGFMQQNVKTRYSDQQLSDYRAKAEAVLDPVGTIQRGKLTVDQVKAIKETSPGIYAEWRQEAMDTLADMNARGTLDKMPYEQKQKISILLEVPADDTLTPAFVASMQKTKQEGAPPSQEDQQASPKTPKRLPRASPTSYQTEGQHLEGTAGAVK